MKIHYMGKFNLDPDSLPQAPGIPVQLFIRQISSVLLIHQAAQI